MTPSRSIKARTKASGPGEIRDPRLRRSYEGRRCPPTTSDSPGCGVMYGRIPRDRWPRSLLEATTENWLLELQESRAHGAHQLALIDPESLSQRSEVAELSFDHDDVAATLHVGRVHVAEEWRSQGLARGLYELLHDLRPEAAVIHTELSPHGQRLVKALPQGWNLVRRRMLEPLPLECTGSMVDPGEDHEVRLVHATGWCPLHECDCGTAEDQNLLPRPALQPGWSRRRDRWGDWRPPRLK